MEKMEAADRHREHAHLATRDIAAVASSADGTRRWLWRVTSVFAGVAAGMLTAEGDLAALIWLIALAVVVIAWASRVTQPVDRSIFVPLASVALTARFALATLAQAFAPGYGGGFVTGDDAGYFRLASHAAGYLRGAPLDPLYGPPDWGGERYLFGMYVYLETALFVIFGANVKILLFLNAAMALGTSFLVYSIATRLFVGAGVAAAAVVAFYPSALLWSALNLKDALTVFAMIGALYSLTRLQLDMRYRWALVSLGLAEALTGMRGYVAAIVAATVPAIGAIVPVTFRRKLVWLAITGMLAGVVVVQTVSAIGAGGPDEVLSLLEKTRHAMAVGARTAFVDPSESFRVISPSEVPSALAHVLFAPFPWMAARLADLVVIPEMLLWYVLLLCTAATLWRERERWRLFLPVMSIFGGLLTVFVLAEGNVGTLLRHRDMMVPLVALQSSPTLISVADWLWRRRRSDT